MQCIGKHTFSKRRQVWLEYEIAAGNEKTIRVTVHGQDVHPDLPVQLCRRGMKRHIKEVLENHLFEIYSTCKECSC